MIEFENDSSIITKDAVYIENCRIPSIIDSLKELGAKESNDFISGKQSLSDKDAFYSNSYTIKLNPKNELNLHILGKENASTITFFKGKQLLKSVKIPDASAYHLRFIDLNDDGKNELILYSAQVNSFMSVKVFQFR